MHKTENEFTEINTCRSLVTARQIIAAIPAGAKPGAYQAMEDDGDGGLSTIRRGEILPWTVRPMPRE